MKNLKTVLGIVSLFAAFIMLSLACATTKDATLPMKYEEVVDISGSKDAIYTKANLVFVDLFNSAKSVLQYSDKEAGVMKGKYVSDLSLPTATYEICSIIDVSVKDGKYKIAMTLSDVTETYNLWSLSAGQTRKVAPNDEILAKMNEKWKNLAAEFKLRMNADTSW
ncbi:MAG: DUF4468 domain-containing protein [Treponema sp.]|nr:DUF4468 domain-containing protein [Treponema sp.]